MKPIRKSSLKTSPSLTRTKTLAATVAALGAAIGVNMGDVFADSSSISKQSPPSTSNTRVMSQRELEDVKKARKGSRTIPRHLQNRPDILSIKGGDKVRMRTRPSSLADKSAPQIQRRPSAFADKTNRPPTK